MLSVRVWQSQAVGGRWLAKGVGLIRRAKAESVAQVLICNERTIIGDGQTG